MGDGIDMAAPLEDESFRAGELGYWQFWGEAISAHDAAAAGGPIHMDVITDAGFASRDWLAEFDRDIVAAVVDGRLATGRVIVPPESLDKPAEDLLELAIGLGFEVRLRSGAPPFVIYGGTTAVLPELDAAGAEGHRRVRHGSVVAALQELFELHWAAAISWEEHRRGTVGVLDFLARGWSDAQIAAALGISPRTVSRRVADAMAAAGARSRFELGMHYGLSRHGSGGR